VQQTRHSPLWFRTEQIAIDLNQNNQKTGFKPINLVFGFFLKTKIDNRSIIPNFDPISGIINP